MIKLNAAGSALVYSTYLGGSNVDVGDAIAVDSAGSAYLTGRTTSTNFITTTNALQPANAGGGDAFVTKFNATGSAVSYSTFLGGNSIDEGFGIALDTSGNAYLTGQTTSSNFLTTTSPIQGTYGGGTDAFVSKVNTGGTALVYSTYLGGSGTDTGYAIAVDQAGSAYVTGVTTSTNFLTTTQAIQASLAGGQDAFVSKLNSAGSALSYSTYLGGTSTDQGKAIAVDGLGYAFVAGDTQSSNFPTAFPRQASRGGLRDALVARIGELSAVQFTSSNTNVAGSAGAATITVTLSTGWPVTVTVHYATSDGTAAAGSDYSTATGTLTCPPGGLELEIWRDGRHACDAKNAQPNIHR